MESRVGGRRGAGAMAEPTTQGRFRCPAHRIPSPARFLLAAHRTGRADFPHPALGQVSCAGMQPNDAPYLQDAVLTMQLLVAEASRSRGQLVPPPQEVPRPVRHVDVHEPKRDCG
jgi:hypothetical protein